MRADDLLEVLAPDDILVRGTRVPLECVIEAFRDGLTPEDIIREYPSIPLPSAYGVIAHYLANREEVDAYIARAEAAAEAFHQELRENSSPTVERLRRIKAARPREQTR